MPGLNGLIVKAVRLASQAWAIARGDMGGGTVGIADDERG